MLKSDVIDFSTKQRYNIEYFDDDTIDTVRLHIANAMDTHPDRLFILVSMRYSNDYYQKDPRRWEALYDRLSYNGQPITDIAFQEYQVTYRTPQTSILHNPYDRSDWMTKPEPLQEIYAPTRDFTELRIFGVEDEKSYVLPFKFNGVLTSRIASANLPLPLTTTLVSTLYDPSSIEKFIVLRYDETAENAANVYFPFLRSVTPNRLNDETVNLLMKNTKLLKDLFELKGPKPPVSTSIARLRLYAKLVDTDFGSAVRTRFEQIFYGLTVSEDVPYVGFFTSKSEISRHKFYKPDPKINKPYLDGGVWNRWWSLSKPIRNQPTLLFYRGKNREHFDRIAITSTDLTVTCYREQDSEESISQLTSSAMKWLKSFDALMAFVEKDDLDSERWKIDDVQFFARYPFPMDSVDLRRFNCLSSIFNIPDNNAAKFGLLRTDRQNYGISALDVKLIQMMTEGKVKPPEIAQELSVTIEEAKRLLADIERKLEEDPNLAQRAFRGYPLIEIGKDEVKVSSITDVDRVIKYVNILLFILKYPDSKSLDPICPKRMESVKVDTGIAPVETFEIDAALEEQYADLFGYLEGEEVEPEKPVEVIEEKPKEKKIPTSQKQFSKYGYFKERLEKFDPDSFASKQAKSYPKSCEQNYQPVILDSGDLDAWEGTPYDPQTYLKEDQFINTYDPDGLIICPEYWCMKDDIPLTEEQLIKEDGEIKCPVCRKKLRLTPADDPREHTVIKRESGFVYPGFKKDIFEKTGKAMPCCFKKPQKKKKEEIEDRYYINRENIVQLKELRISFLSQQLLDSLSIKETYEVFGTTKRIQNGMSGFFRIGIGRPSETLPDLLNLKTKISPPHLAIETVLKCSFLRTWKLTGESNLKTIQSALAKISPYDKDELVRENLARIIAGIDEAFEKKQLSIIEELEYSSLFLQCDIFRIFTPANTLGCLFYSPIVRPRSRGIIILQNGNVIDLLCHVTRLPRGFQYKSNIFESPFKKETYTLLEKLRTDSCKTKIPSFDDGLNAVKEVLIASEQPDFQVVLDPYGRAQAFYIPNHMILPFQPSPLPEMVQPKLLGYNSIQSETLPKYENARKYLDVATNLADGYEWAEDLYNNDGDRVEILLKSGLRVPVQPEKLQQDESTEVIETTNKLTEDKLVYGEESAVLEKEYKKLSYESEVYEFLIFELTNAIKVDYLDLREALQEVRPKLKDIEPLLRQWFDNTVRFVNIDTPFNFLSKVRTPCGQFKSKDTCDGNLCAWTGKVCGVQVKSSIRKEALFNRLLTAVVENAKIRSMILDGRTSPFFSTILYLELPHEIILTDLDIVNISV